jgi:hypothetical protein
MNAIRTLERAALAAHRRGTGWATFWQEHAQAIRQAEPWDRGRFRTLVNRLMHLVASGDGSGEQPAGDDDAPPWVVDDAPGPHDSQTQAHCLLPLRALPGVTTANTMKG